MTQEEKAKAYDNALEIAKGLYAKDAPDSLHLERMFPQLKESEDERMWKLIKKYAHYNISDLALEADHITREQLETWLKKQGEQNPAWNEWDEEILSEIIYFFEKGIPTVQHDFRIYVSWLRSLKQRYIWQPSDEQMKVLLSEVNAWTKGCPKQKILKSLYDDLLKLKG